MMSGHAAAREPRFKPETPRKWYTPPPGTPLFAAIPRATREYHPLLTKQQRALLEILQSSSFAAAQGTPAPRQMDDKSWHCKPPGKTAIAAALECDRATVRRSYRELEAKHFIQTGFEYFRGTRKVRARLVLIFSYAEALERRRQDPRIAKTNDRRVVFRGRGRRPMTPEDALVWQVQMDNVPEFEESLDAPDLEREVEDDAPDAMPERREAAAVTPLPPPAPAPARLLDALIDAVRDAGAPGEKDAEDCWRAAGKDIAEDVVAELVGAIAEGRRKINPAERHTVGYFIKRLPDYAERHRREAKKAEAERRRLARIEFDRKVNHIAELLGRPPHPEDAEIVADLLRDAGEKYPAEMAAARQLVEKLRARGVG